jgi:hypothetical protein
LLSRTSPRLSALGFYTYGFECNGGACAVDPVTACYCLPPRFRRDAARRPDRDRRKTSSSEPDVEKKAAYGALADVLENDAARQELIDQLRKAAATPPPDSTPEADAAGKKENHGAGKRHPVSREYGERSLRAFLSCGAISPAPHKPFNAETFHQRRLAFPAAGRLVFAFWWLVRLAALPLYRKMGQWGRHKNRDRGNWLQLPATIAGAFISICCCWR